MTQLEVIRLLLAELKRSSPAQYQQLVSEVLTALGAEEDLVIDLAFAADRHPVKRTLH